MRAYADSSFILRVISEVFLTTDDRQAQLAKAEGLNVLTVTDAE